MNGESTPETTVNGKIYVKFGPHPTQEIPVEWAQMMLTELKNSSPALFGRLLTKAVGIEPKGRT